MELLFIKSFIDGDFEALKSKFLIIGIMWGLVLVAVIIDFLFGVSKSTKAGVTITSGGLRRTVIKMLHYYSLLLFGLMFDIILSYFWSSPLITSLITCYLVYVEFVSVKERYDEKISRDLRANLADLLTVLSEKDRLEAISKILERNISEDKKNSGS